MVSTFLFSVWFTTCNGLSASFPSPCNSWIGFHSTRLKTLSREKNYDHYSVSRLLFAYWRVTSAFGKRLSPCSRNVQNTCSSGVFCLWLLTVVFTQVMEQLQGAMAIPIVVTVFMKKRMTGWQKVCVQKSVPLNRYVFNYSGIITFIEFNYLNQGSSRIV